MVSRRIIKLLENFARDTLKFEKKKLILPSIAVLIILIAFFLGSHLRSEGVDSRLVETNTEYALDRQISYSEEELFNRTFNETRAEEISDRSMRTNPLRRPDRYEPYNLLMAEYAALTAVYSSPFYPIAPGHSQKALIFTPDRGYYLTEEVPHGATVRVYRIEAMENLREKTNNSDMSIEEFRSEVELIRSREVNSPELEQQVQTRQPEDRILRLAGNLGPEEPEQMIGQTLENQVKEIGLLHLVPAILGALIWNYIISGVILTGWRDFKKDVNRFSEKDHFFRNNLLISATAASLIVLTAQLVFEPNNFISITGGTLASSLFWLGLFAAVTNETRKYTRYAWILTGITLNLVIPAIAEMIGYDGTTNFIFQTFIVGATAFYPLILGVLSEYGRIRGEKHLRKRLNES